MPTTFPEDGVFVFGTVLWKDGVTVKDMITINMGPLSPTMVRKMGQSLKHRDAASIGVVNPQGQLRRVTTLINLKVAISRA